MRSPAFKIFTMLFGAMYTASFYMDWALFRYYPEVGEFHLFRHNDLGPVVPWYGWLARAGLVSAAVAFAVPRSWSERLWPGWVWLAPAMTIVVILFYEKRWFV